MTSAARFWPGRLFKLGAKPDPDAAFVPSTEIAARIMTKPMSQATSGTEFTSFDPAALGSTVGDPVTLDAANDWDDTRQSERFVPTRPNTTLVDGRGKQIRARIINMSATGVAIEADFRVMPPDSVTMVGAKQVTMGRPIRGGHVFIFDKPLDPARCNPQILL